MAYSKTFKSAKYLKDGNRDAAIETTYDEKSPIGEPFEGLTETEKESDIILHIEQIDLGITNLQEERAYHQAKLDYSKQK